MSDNGILQLGAFELAHRIKAHEFSPIEVLETHLQWIQKLNPRLNAIVVGMYDQARKAAEVATEALYQEKELGVLHGVPCTIKESIGVEGCPNTIGSFYRRADIAKEDATVVKRLKQAGAIPMGLTNLPEMSFWSETDNIIYGRTNNPYDLERTPGGSSGGEASIIAAGCSPFGIGSDIAGSIRMPAFYCGVFAHKPTAGLVPLTGMYPMTGSLATELNRGGVLYTGLGPLCRRADDLLPLLQILSGPDDVDPNTCEVPDLREKTINWSDKTVYICPAPHLSKCSPVSREIQDVIKSAAESFEEQGAHIEELDPQIFRTTLDLWRGCLGDGAMSMEELLGGAYAINAWQELGLFLLGRSHHTFPALLFCFLDKFQYLDESKIQASIQESYRLREQIEALLGDHHILITPPQPTPAPKHNQLLLRPLDFGYTAIFNVLQLPTTAVPMGLNWQGLPVGVQITASRKQDAVSIAAAQFLEEEHGGWVFPGSKYTHWVEKV